MFIIVLLFKLKELGLLGEMVCNLGTGRCYLIVSRRIVGGDVREKWEGKLVEYSIMFVKI